MQYGSEDLYANPDLMVCHLGKPSKHSELYFLIRMLEMIMPILLIFQTGCEDQDRKYLKAFAVIGQLLNGAYLSTLQGVTLPLRVDIPSGVERHVCLV